MQRVARGTAGGRWSRSGRACAVGVVAVLTAFLTLPQPPARAATVPSGFTNVVYASGLTRPVAMAFAPDGRLFVTDQSGKLRVIKNGVQQQAPFVQVTTDSTGERGLLGVAFDPNFSTNKYVYVYYTATTPNTHNRVSRFVANGDVALRGANGAVIETFILELGALPLAKIHNGGTMHFGPDGKLYIATGDTGAGTPAQRLDNLFGKILRINPDGTVPSDNPFNGSATGINRAIWAMGLRNPFTFAIQPGTGRMYINDVGQSTWEEINDGVAGGNYGWPTTEGPTSNPNFITPIYYYGHGTTSDKGCAITGGTFYNPATSRFPTEYVGDYFFGDFCNSWIKRRDPGTKVVTSFSTAVSQPVDIQTGPDGNLYYLLHGTNNILKVSHTATNAPQISEQPAGQLVSTGHPATFSVSATGPGPLTYRWQRNDVNISGATSPSYTIASVATSDNNARFKCIVSNPAGFATSNSAVLTVTTQQPPTVTITEPAGATFYTGGEVIDYAGDATDPETGEQLPDSAFTWQVDYHHDDHEHPWIPAKTGSRSGAFQTDANGHTETNVYYRITLTVRDSVGLVTEAFRDVLPQKVDLALSTVPAGLTLDLDSQPRATPFADVTVVGVNRILSAPDQTVANGDMYEFVSWSDGGERTHAIDALDAVDGTASYTATYRKIDAPDLVVTDLSWSPVAPAAGGGVRFSATVRNQGTAATPAGVVHGVLFKVDGVAKTWSDASTSSLAPDESVTLSANGGGQSGLWTATGGAHTVLAHVDDVNRIPGEVNETNNTLSAPLTVTGSTVPTVITLGPTADTFGNAGAPNTNYGTNASLSSRGTPGAASYLRFTLPTAPDGKTLTGAVLKLRTTTDPNSGSAANHPVRVAGNIWTETALTWTNKPAITGALLGTITGARAVNTAYSTPLTPAAVAPLLNSIQTFEITSTGSDGLYVWSRNVGTVSSRPQLVLTFT